MVTTEGIKTMVGVMLVGSALILGLGGFGSWVVALMFVTGAVLLVAGIAEGGARLTLPHPCERV